MVTGRTPGTPITSDGRTPGDNGMGGQGLGRGIVYGGDWTVNRLGGDWRWNNLAGPASGAGASKGPQVHAAAPLGLAVAWRPRDPVRFVAPQGGGPSPFAEYREAGRRFAAAQAATAGSEGVGADAAPSCAILPAHTHYNSGSNEGVASSGAEAEDEEEEENGLGISRYSSMPVVALNFDPPLPPMPTGRPSPPFPSRRSGEESVEGGQAGMQPREGGVHVSALPSSPVALCSRQMEERAAPPPKQDKARARGGPSAPTASAHSGPCPTYSTAPAPALTVPGMGTGKHVRVTDGPSPALPTLHGTLGAGQVQTAGAREVVRAVALTEAEVIHADAPVQVPGRAERAAHLLSAADLPLPGTSAPSPPRVTTSNAEAVSAPLGMSVGMGSGPVSTFTAAAMLRAAGSPLPARRGKQGTLHGSGDAVAPVRKAGAPLRMEAVSAPPSPQKGQQQQPAPTLVVHTTPRKLVHASAPVFTGIYRSPGGGSTASVPGVDGADESSRVPRRGMAELGPPSPPSHNSGGAAGPAVEMVRAASGGGGGGGLGRGGGGAGGTQAGKSARAPFGARPMNTPAAPNGAKSALVASQVQAALQLRL